MRTRIVAAGVLLTALALTGAGLAAYLLEYNRLDQQVDDNVAQELDEFQALRRDGVDARTGQAFENARALLRTALVRNVPDSSEALIAYWGGSTQHKSGDTVFPSATQEPFDFAAYAPFEAAIADLLPEGLRGCRASVK